jgi:hypothetical protein
MAVATRPTTTGTTTATLRSLGFVDAPKGPPPKRLVISAAGRQKSGKTHLILTGPEPIVLFDIDIGLEGVVENFAATGKEILLYHIVVQKGEKQSVYEAQWDDFETKVRRSWELKEGTVAIDSVTAENPLVLRDRDEAVWVGAIEDFWGAVSPPQVTVTTKGEEIIDLRSSGWRVATTRWEYESKSKGARWSPIKSIIRHPYKGKILKITTAGGTIRVTPNHSLMVLKGGRGVGCPEASSLKVGNLLSTPMYSRDDAYLTRSRSNCTPFVGPTEIAWLYGFFVAEGSTPHYRDKRCPSYDGMRVGLVNKKEEPILRAKRILEDNFHVAVSFGRSKDGLYYAKTSNVGVAKHFDSLFYNSAREKVVPPCILNAIPEVRQQFTEGYLAGDGHYGKGNTWSFATTSPALAAALIWMERSSSLSSHDVSVYTRADKPTVIQVTLPARAVGPRGRIRSVVEEEYEGMVYDLETENHYFCAGVGGILAHNTGSEGWELKRLAKFGKVTQVRPHHYTEANADLREFLRQAYTSKTNTIITHKMKPEYVNEQRTGEWEVAGWKEISYFTQMNVVLERVDFKGKPSRYTMRVADCRHDRAEWMAGLVIPKSLCNLPFLLDAVHTLDKETVLAMIDGANQAEAEAAEE